jgi:hypothetical protein
MPALDSQKCPNGHPCDNDGHCRTAGCPYAKPALFTDREG